MYLVHGGDMKGIERIAASWAEQNGIQQVRFGLDRKLGDRAGFRRNEQMLSLKPRYVIAFQGNGVTERLVIDAKKAGIRVVDRRGPLGTPARSSKRSARPRGRLSFGSAAGKASGLAVCRLPADSTHFHPSGSKPMPSPTCKDGWAKLALRASVDGDTYHVVMTGNRSTPRASGNRLFVSVACSGPRLHDDYADRAVEIMIGRAGFPRRTAER